jgi:proteasome assembly chaperone (PAC2) family protein
MSEAEDSTVKTEILRMPNGHIRLAVASSPGLRAVGLGALQRLMNETKLSLLACIFSKHFPTLYDTVPSYAAKPKAYGFAGVILKNGTVEYPAVKIYYASERDIIIVEGYHANFYGQYEVAEATVNVLKKFGVKRLIVLAGYAVEGELVCCAASKPEILKEAERFGVKPQYIGPFIGFSGLLAGLALLEKIEVLCLFGRTTPKPDEPEKPDPEASEQLYRKLCEILNKTI